MRTIGIRELQEASYGRDLVLEGVDIRGFFDKCKQFFVTMFKRITEAFKNAAKVIMSSFASDKNLAAKYAKDIKAGFNSKWSATGYVFEDNITLINLHDVFDDIDKKATEEALKNINQPEMGDISQRKALSHFNKMTQEDVIERICDAKNLGECHSAAEYREALTKSLRVKGKDKPVELNGEITYDQIIANLKNDKEVKDIKKSYDEIKKSFNKTLTGLEELKKSMSKEDGNNATKNRRMAFVTGAVSTLKNIKSVQSITFAVTLNTAKQKRAQARKMALYFIRHSKGAKATTTQESAGIFGALDMI